MRRHSTDWQKISGKDISGKGLFSELYKELLNSTIRTQTHLKSGPKTFKGISPKKTYRSQINVGAPYHISAE